MSAFVFYIYDYFVCTVVIIVIDVTIVKFCQIHLIQVRDILPPAYYLSTPLSGDASERTGAKLSYISGK